MKTLKQDNEKRIVLYSFETKEELINYHAYLAPEKESVFFGDKSVLLQQDEEFWKPLVESNGSKNFKNYKTKWQGDTLFNCTAKESGLSAISGCKEFILIVEEKI